VCVCVWECVCVCVCVCVIVCVCVCVHLRIFVYVCERESERERDSVCMRAYIHTLLELSPMCMLQIKTGTHAVRNESNVTKQN